MAGRLELTIDGEAGTYAPGDTYDTGAGQEHSARLEKARALSTSSRTPTDTKPGSQKDIDWCRRGSNSVVRE